MNRDIGPFIAPIVAILLFAFVAVQTYGALQSTGAWAKRASTPVLASDDPFVILEQRLTDPRAPVDPASVEDPFGSPPAPVAVTPTVPGGPPRPRPVLPTPPPTPPRPVLTAIVWDSDPRALVRWQGREYTIRDGGLFDEFQVVRVARDQVVLSRGAETLVLKPNPQGE